MVSSPPPAHASIGPWITRGVQMVRDRLGPWLLLSLLSQLPMLVAGIVVTWFYTVLLLAILPRATEGPDVALDAAALQARLALAVPAIGVAVVVGTAATIYLLIGMYRAALRQLDGEAPRVSDLAVGPGDLGRAIGATTLSSLLTLAGLLLCVVPGLIVAGRLQFAVPLALDRGLSAGAAVRASWEATSADTLGFTLHFLAVGTLASLGAYLCGVGILFTWPLLFTATAAGYRELFPLRAEARLRPSLAGW